MKSFLLLICLSLYQQNLISEVRGDVHTDSLANALLSGYLPIASPGNITLDLALNIIHLEYDPNVTVLTVSGWEYYTWTDDRLRWDPAAFGGVKTLRVPEKNVWKPDIMLNNAYQLNHERTPVNAVVQHDGVVTWIPPSVFQVRCPVNRDAEETGSLPEDDIIHCSMKFGSWTSDGSRIRLTSSSGDRLLIDDYVPNRRLQPVSSTSKVNSVIYECCPDPYMDFTAALELKYFG